MTMLYDTDLQDWEDVKKLSDEDLLSALEIEGVSADRLQIVFQHVCAVIEQAHHQQGPEAVPACMLPRTECDGTPAFVMVYPGSTDDPFVPSPRARVNARICRTPIRPGPAADVKSRILDGVCHSIVAGNYVEVVRLLAHRERVSVYNLPGHRLDARQRVQQMSAATINAIKKSEEANGGFFDD